LRHGGIIEHGFLNIKYIITIEKDFWNTHAEAFIMPSQQHQSDCPLEQYSFNHSSMLYPLRCRPTTLVRFVGSVKAARQKL